MALLLSKLPIGKRVDAMHTILTAIVNRFLHLPTIGSVASLSSKRADSLGLDVSKVEQLVGYGMPNLESVVRELYREWR